MKACNGLLLALISSLSFTTALPALGDADGHPVPDIIPLPESPSSGTALTGDSSKCPVRVTLAEDLSAIRWDVQWYLVSPIPHYYACR